MRINKIIYLLFFIIFTVKCKDKMFTIMLDPAGDAQNTGRQIDDCLERGITLQFAQRLKQELEKELDNIRVVLTRFPGESIENLQNANFANRLDIDFSLSIHFYKEKEVKPQAYIYTFAYHDDFITRKPELYFYDYDKAHQISRGKTKKCAGLIKDIFVSDAYKKRLDLQGVMSLPFKPLIGVKAPAVGIEIGLKSKEDWVHYLDLFVDCVSEIVNV